MARSFRNSFSKWEDGLGISVGLRTGCSVGPVNSPCDLLIVAAFAPELEGLEPLLGEGMQADVGGLSFCAKPIGIGLISAASGAASRVEAAKPRAVALIGTCGAYPRGGLDGSSSGGSGRSSSDRASPARRYLAMGDVVVGKSVFLVDASVAAGKAAFPEPMSTQIDPHPALTAALSVSGAPRVNIATTLAITTDDALAAHLGQATDTAVEHLEAFAVGTACAALDVPYAVVLGVANIVGSKGRAQWRTGHRAAAEAAASYIARWVQAGGAGVPHR